MADEQDRAEDLDEDNVSTEFPPDQPMGVEDPTQDDRVDDSFESRDERHLPEGEDDTEPAVLQPFVSEDEALLDDEKDLVGEAMMDDRDPYADGAPAPAEEAALHLEE